MPYSSSADSPHWEWMPKVWYSSYTSQVRVSFQIRTLLTSIPLTAQTISCSQDSVYRAGPDIPKLSAGQGLSSLTMNRSTHPRHSSREVFVGTRKRHHGRVGIAGMLCHHLLMAPCMGVPDGFTYKKALGLSPSLSSGVLHLPSSSSV